MKLKKKPNQAPSFGSSNIQNGDFCRIASISGVIKLRNLQKNCENGQKYNKNIIFMRE